MPVDTSSSRCGVIGSPIAHSLSPVLHRAAYRELGLDWSYDAHDVTVDTVDAFLSDVARDPGWVGLSVTMPLKAAVMRHCADLDTAGQAVGAVNTLLRQQSGGFTGANTDVTGFVAALSVLGRASVQRATVVGAGATAGSAICALAQCGAESVTVLSRSVDRAEGLDAVAERAGLQLRRLPLSTTTWPEVDVLVSTIPAAAQTTIARQASVSAAVVFDVTYDPADTPLLEAAASAGRVVIGGFELLLRQASFQVELMTGAASAPLAAMRAAGETELRRRSRSEAGH